MAKTKDEAKPKKAAKAKDAKDDSNVKSSKFAEFVAQRKLDPRRIIAASRALEKFRPEDREIKLGKRRARAAEGGEGAPKETRKPRSGRPVTSRAIDAALKGGQVSGPTKTRIVRAVNRLLEQKKQEKVEFRALF
jgi:hypothetical protein